MEKPVLLVVSPLRLAALLAINVSVSARKSGGDVRVLPAGSGGGGIQVAEEAQPAVVLAEPRMSDMDATELLRRLRANQATRGIPVVLLTDVAHVAAVFARRGVDPDRAWNAVVGIRRMFARRSGR